MSISRKMVGGGWLLTWNFKCQRQHDNRIRGSFTGATELCFGKNTLCSNCSKLLFIVKDSLYRFLMHIDAETIQNQLIYVSLKQFSWSMCETSWWSMAKYIAISDRPKKFIIKFCVGQKPMCPLCTLLLNYPMHIWCDGASFLFHLDRIVLNSFTAYVNKWTFGPSRVAQNDGKTTSVAKPWPNRFAWYDIERSGVNSIK